MKPLDLNLVDIAAKNASAAFKDEPSNRYAIPDPAKRANLHHIYRYFIKLCVLSGSKAFVTSHDCEGLAIWTMSGTKPSWWHEIQAGVLGLPFRFGWHFLRYTRSEERFADKLKRKYAPNPHMYLSLLSVAPEHQGKGFGSRLIKPMIKYLDANQLPCYLETQNMKNVAMYQNFGFLLLESTFFPPGSNCEVHIMLRKPGAQSMTCTEPGKDKA